MKPPVTLADQIQHGLLKQMEGYKSRDTKISELQEALEELRAMVKTNDRYKYHRNQMLASIATIEKGFHETTE